MRPLTRWGLRRGYQLLGAVLLRRPATLSVADLVQDWKRSDRLALLAPGASINRLPPQAWQALLHMDTVGVNYFLLHEYTARAYIIEPHEDRGYFDYLAQHADRFGNSTFFYKGYASPGKLGCVVRELRRFRDAGIRDAWMLDERYLHDARHRSEEALEEWLQKGSAAVHSGSSLTFLMDLAWRMKYRHVLLVGFDFSSDYFYADRPDSARITHVASKIVHGTDRGTSMFNRMREYVDRIRSDGGEVWHLGGEGPVVSKLPEYRVGSCSEC